MGCVVLALLLAALPARGATLAGAEWFLGTDPGPGSATAVAAADGVYDTSAEEIATQAIAVSGLAPGNHRIGLRFRDTDGLWGNEVFVDVQVVDSATLPLDPPLLISGVTALRTLAAAEFALDGGTATPLAAADGAFDAVWEGAAEAVVSAASLTAGTHRVAMRFQDTGGLWGNEVFVDVQVLDSATLPLDPPLLISGVTALRTLVAAEVFFDIDPGVGLGMAVLPEDGAYNSVAEMTQTLAVDPLSIPAGIRRIGLRLQDNNGVWGTAAFVDVEVIAAGPERPFILAQPQGVLLEPGLAAATFSVTAVGDGVLAYQWRKNGVDLGGANGATLAFVPANRAAGGAYSVVVTNAFGSVTSNPALLRVMVAQRMERPEKLAGGTFKLRFSDGDGVGLTELDKNGFTLQWSTNLVQWFDLTNATRSVVGGKVELEDADAAGKARKFYRVLER